jgi:hypothetical protein
MLNRSFLVLYLLPRGLWAVASLVFVFSYEPSESAAELCNLSVSNLTVANFTNMPRQVFLGRRSRHWFLAESKAHADPCVSKPMFVSYLHITPCGFVRRRVGFLVCDATAHACRFGTVENDGFYLLPK